MQITIVEADIKTAITNFILDQVMVRDGKTLEIELAATRGANGFTATIDIVDTPAPAAEEAPRRGRPAAPKSATTQPEPGTVTIEPTPKAVKASGTKPLGIAAKAEAAKTAPEPEAAPEAIPEPEAPIEEAQPEPEVAETLATKEVEPETVADNSPSVDDGQVEDATAPAVEEEAPQRQSLFSGLKKPTN